MTAWGYYLMQCWVMKSLLSVTHSKSERQKLRLPFDHHCHLMLTLKSYRHVTLLLELSDVTLRSLEFIVKKWLLTHLYALSKEIFIDLIMECIYELYFYIPPRREWVNLRSHGPCFFFSFFFKLTEAKWCINASPNLGIITSNNGLLPFLYQTIIWTNAGLLPVWPLWTYFSEIWTIMQQFLLKKMCAKWWPFHLSLNE